MLTRKEKKVKLLATELSDLTYHFMTIFTFNGHTAIFGMACFAMVTT